MKTWGKFYFEGLKFKSKHFIKETRSSILKVVVQKQIQSKNERRS